MVHHWPKELQMYLFGTAQFLFGPVAQLIMIILSQTALTLS